MFAWSRTFYAEKDNVYYNFEMKKQRDDAVRHHKFRKVSAAEAYKHSLIRVHWTQYDKFISNVDNKSIDTNIVNVL